MSSTENYALITGATSGIGYELAKLFAQNGYNLVIVARTQSDLDSAAVEFKQHNSIEVVKISTDLFDPLNAFILYDEINSQGLNVTVLVNDAGQGMYGEFVNTDIRRELDIINLNIASLVILTKKFLQDMVANGEGKILNVASIASKIPGPFQSVYHATKAFVHSFTEAIRDEVKDKGITVTSLLPGVTDTDFFSKADMLDSKVVQDKDKMADPADVAKDGYEALMAGKDMVVPGAMNKVQVAVSNVTPDTMLAAQVHKQQEPVSENT